jgi:hypothetical protein
MHTESDTNEPVGRALRALPADDAQPCSWLEFQRRQAQAVRASPIGVPQLAAATLAVAAVAFLAVWARLEHGRGAPSTELIASSALPGAPGDDSRAAERWLASLPREPGIVRVGTRADVLRLEDRIAQVDDLLTAGRAGRIETTHLVALQRERAQLVTALARVRYAETLADELP